MTAATAGCGRDAIMTRREHRADLLVRGSVRKRRQLINGWHGWVGTFTGVAFITVAVLPLAVLAVWALARRRSVTGATPAWRTSLAEIGIVYGTVP
jgi:hypothetical protein